MRYELKRSFSASELADRVGAQLSGADLIVDSIAAVGDRQPGALTYWQEKAPPPDELPLSACVLVRKEALQHKLGQACFLVCRNPRMEFIRLLRWFEREKLFGVVSRGEVHTSAEIHPTAVVESGASIGAGCCIGPVSHITSWTSLGKNVVVGSGSVVGRSGFGYERDENGVPVAFPHFGRVIVEDNCDIGSNTTIARGNLTDTTIGQHVKVDDQVYVAHNSTIGDSSMIAGGVRICGSVVIGSQCWIGAGAMILQNLEVGDRAVVGLGTVVVRSVAAETVVAGNPARVLRQS